MLNRALTGLAIWTFIAGCCFALGETSVPAAQSVDAQPPAAPEPVRVVPLPRPESAVHQEMWMLERQARVGMILYTGRFGQAEWPPAKVRLDAVALTLGTGTK